jgi:antitoxin component of RelBE/YafQ-DinJ toxin-antitoxin module
MNKVNTSIRLNAILKTELKDLCEANGIPITKAIETLIALLKTDINLQQRVFAFKESKQ